MKPPTKPGFYWALWIKSSNHEVKVGKRVGASKDWWEVVEVWENYIGEDRNDGEKLAVSVAGVRETQWLNDFIWGDIVTRPDSLPCYEGKVSKPKGNQ